MIPALDGTRPAVYVGTFAKYNSGSLEGAWLYVEDYADKEDFLKACAELHADESDPELMFQDSQYLPKCYVGESFIKDEVWEFLALDDWQMEAVEAYLEHVGEDSIDFITERFCGVYKDAEDWACEYLKDTGAFEGAADMLQNYFDFEAYARDCELNGDMQFVEVGSRVFVFHS